MKPKPDCRSAERKWRHTRLEHCLVAHNLETRSTKKTYFTNLTQNQITLQTAANSLLNVISMVLIIIWQI